MAETRRKGFNLAEALGAVAAPDLGTAAGGREQIEYIDIDRIDDDPNNFYELAALDELAANIELLGLQQPLRVRANLENTDRVIIVSGHRRRAAIRKLVDDGRADLREIPCIRERSESSAALQELRLIYANSDTRKLSSAEISKQAERVEALLYQLKEEGYEFPGRMRDHVAEACKVSKSKLARLKVIRDGLDPVWQRAYEKDGLPESTAYTLARLPVEHQRAIAANHKASNENARWFYENEASTLGKKMAAIDQLTCKKDGGAPCANISEKYTAIHRQSKWYSDNPCSKCCDKCENLASCKNACLKLAAKIKRLKDDARAQRKQEKTAQEEKDRPVIGIIKRVWDNFGRARAAADKSVKECFAAMGVSYPPIGEDEVMKLECLEGKYSTSTLLPYAYHLRVSDVQAMVKIADLLGVSLDYLLGRTDNLTPGGYAAQPNDPCTACKSAHPWCDKCCASCEDKCNGSQRCSKDDAEKWVHLSYIDGFRKPTRTRQDAVALFRLEKGEAPIRMIATWINGAWHISPDGARIDAECVGWFPLPEEGDYEDT